MKKPALIATITLSLALAACNMGTDGGDSGANAADAASVDRSAAMDADGADEMASNDPAPGQKAEIAIPDSEERPTMQMQVVLDRLGFTPGVVDGKMGLSTRNAIEGFQEANSIDVSGKADEKTKQALAEWGNIPATRVVKIPASFAQDEFKDIPGDPAKKAEMKRLGYTSLDEKLAERFHTTIETLKMLNPGGRPAGMKETGETGGQDTAPQQQKAGDTADSDTQPGKQAKEKKSYFAAGQQIRVPNIGADKIASGQVGDEGWKATLRSLGVGSEQPEADRIVVSESEGTLKAFDKAGKLIAMYTATMGSKNDPLPLGDWKILGVAHNPPFAYNPELFWDVPDDQEKQMMPPGPNGPVGVVWIDLSKEHYGIHGTPEPQTIGRAQSHGCIRLTNWDAARLAQMVSTNTKAIFES